MTPEQLLEEAKKRNREKAQNLLKYGTTKNLKGDKGDSIVGEKGEKGDKGDRGEKGDKGDRGLPGKDGKNGKDGKDGRDGKDGLNGKDGKDGQDFTPNLEELAINTVNFLEMFEGEERLDAKAIKNIEENIDLKKLDLSKVILNAKQVKGIQDLLPKHPPTYGGGSGATFLKSMRDVDLAGLADGYVLKWDAAEIKWKPESDSSGVSDFLSLTDTPSSYTSQGLKAVRVNSGETALEFYTPTDANDAVLVSANDTTAGFLNDKIVDSSEIEWTENNDGGNETFSSSIVAGSIDETKLDSSVNASLDLADSATQPGDNISTLTNDSGFISDITGENIGDLSDVTITTIADNEILQYNSGSGIWENQTLGEAGISAVGHTHTLSDITDSGALAALDDITTSEIDAATLVIESEGIAANDNDTTIPTSAAVKDYVDTQVATVNELGELTDVTITTPADNEVLAYDTTSGEWINQTPAEAGLAATSHTHTASEITDFDTEVSNNTDVAANTAARHDAVTVLDSSEIDFTLTGQNLTASIIAGSIDETKLDVSTNASLDLADSSVQPGDNVSTLTNDAGYLTAESDTLADVTGRGATTTNNITIDGGGLVNSQINIHGSTHHALISTATDVIKIRDTSSAADRLAIDGSGNMTINNAFTLPNADGSANQILRTDGSGNVEWYTPSTVTDTFATIQVDGVAVSTNAPTLDFDSTYFTLTESPTDDFDITINDSGIDHDATTNFVANEHIDHTAVTLTAGSGLTGGGDISANRSFSVDSTVISDKTDTVITASDTILFGDATDSNNLKKDTVQGILDLVPAGVSFGSANQIPTVNATTDDFDYSSKFTFDDSNGYLTIGTAVDTTHVGIGVTPSTSYSLSIEASNDNRFNFIGKGARVDSNTPSARLEMGGQVTSGTAQDGDEHALIFFKATDDAGVFGNAGAIRTALSDVSNGNTTHKITFENQYQSSIGTTRTNAFVIDGIDTHLPNDGAKSYYGSGDDASINYNGTHLRLNPKESGSGVFAIDGNLSVELSSTGVLDTARVISGLGVWSGNANSLEGQRISLGTGTNTSTRYDIGRAPSVGVGGIYNLAGEMYFEGYQGTNNAFSFYTNQSTTRRTALYLSNDGNAHLPEDDTGLYLGEDDDIYHHFDGTGYAIDGLGTATVATGDKVLIEDADDSDYIKTVTAQSIADLYDGDSTYLRLDTTNDPLTGNLEILKTDPELRLTYDDANDYYSRLYRTTSNTTYLKSHVTVPARASNALRFDGSSDRGATVTDNDMLAYGTGLFTATARVKTSDVSTTIRVIMGAYNGAGLFIQYKGSDDSWYAGWSGSGGQFLTGNYSVNDGNWHHVALRRTASDTVELWVDGAVRITKTGITATTMTQPANFEIGTSAVLTGREWNGDIDEVIIWGRQLTDAELGDMYNSGSGLYMDPADTFPSTATSISTNLTCLYHLDEGTGTAIADSSANGYDGSLENSPTWINPGFFAETSAIEDVTILTATNGISGGEKGVITLGNGTSNTNIQGGSIDFDIGVTTHWNIDSSGDLLSANDSNLRIQSDTAQISLGAGDDISFSYNATTNSLDVNTVADANLVAGNGAGAALTSGARNFLWGDGAGASLTSGSDSIAIGKNALASEDTIGMIAIGYEALKNNTGYYNVALGNFAMGSGSGGGNSNTALGFQTMYSTSSGSNNTGVGYYAMHSNTSGTGNTAVGYLAQRYRTTGNFNVAIGREAGHTDSLGANVTTGTSGVFIGYDSRPYQTGYSNEIVIGDTARGNGSNTITLGNSSITDTHISGNVIAGGTVRLKGYTVATLPTGTQGDTAFVTDATAPTYLATVVGGGAVVTPVFYDGTNWVCH